MRAEETVLVTGASAGIGRELARRFARAGSNLVLLARREGRLRELSEELASEYDVRADVCAADLRDPAAPRRVFDRLNEKETSVDVLVNNAGFGARGEFADLDGDRQMDMLQVNVNAVTHLARLFLPGMIQRGRGGIVNLASTASFQPGPGMAVYYATKAYVLSFSEALYEEVRDTGVTVTCLAPGPTDTEFAERAGTDSALVSRLMPSTVEDVAREGYEGFRSGKAIVVPGITNRMGTFVVAITPRALTRRVVRFLNTGR
ncbi:MAG: SDR family oxidoreductase [Rhodothermales bacterium]